MKLYRTKKYTKAGSIKFSIRKSTYYTYVLQLLFYWVWGSLLRCVILLTPTDFFKKKPNFAVFVNAMVTFSHFYFDSLFKIEIKVIYELFIMWRCRIPNFSNLIVANDSGHRRCPKSTICKKRRTISCCTINTI